ncbi:unnamed protein product [marine sediment metagenome]|uniref:Uncharacterized protein n=1 Tax=marine sediment metagenome TaxID=412755 RepID=X0X422_9ZZZZ
MIIWRGLGFLVAVIVFVNSLIANLITNTITGNESYWEEHKWPFALSLVVSGLICWFLGKYLDGRKGRTLIDKETGEEIRVGAANELFFIKMYLWGPILLIFAILALIYDFTS